MDAQSLVATAQIDETAGPCDEPQARTKLSGAAVPCKETVEMLEGLGTDFTRVETLDTLVRALVSHGLWGAVGRMTWARDASDGILLRWEAAPVAPPA